MGNARVLDGVNDWLNSELSLGSNVEFSFTIASWIETSDSAGVDRAIWTAHDATNALQVGFYWNKDELLVKYAYRPPGSPGAAGTNEEKSVSYTTAMGTPTFIAVTATMDVEDSTAAVPTFRFYAGTTFANIVQIGGSFTASGSIKGSSRDASIGVETTGVGLTPVAGTYYNGKIERLGVFEAEPYSLAELAYFAENGVPHSLDAIATVEYPAGQNFEMWETLEPSDTEKDISLNNYRPIIHGDNVTTDTIIPPAEVAWSLITSLGVGEKIASFAMLDNGRILAGVEKYIIGTPAPAEIWYSDDDGETWTLGYTFPTSPNQFSITIILDLGGGTVIAAGPVYGPPNGDPRLWQSTDYGDTWTLAASLSGVHTGSEFQGIQSLLDLGGGTVLAGTGTGGVVYRSTNSGGSWASFATISGITTCRCLLNLGGGVLLAGGDANNIYRSTDSGANWSFYSTMTPGTVSRVVMREISPGRIIAATDAGDAYLSTDSGATWTRTLDTEDYLDFYDNDPTNTILELNGKWYLRTHTLGYVYESDDDGATWGRFFYNTHGPTGVGAGLAVPDANRLIFSGNFWICDTDLRIYGLTFATPEIRVVETYRTFSYSREVTCETGPFACDCGPVQQLPEEERTNSYLSIRIQNVAQRRIISWNDSADGDEFLPPALGEVAVTRVQKLLEYRLLPTPAAPIIEGVPVLCDFRPRIRILRVEDLVQVFELDQYATLTYTKRWTELNEFELTMSADTEQAARMRELAIVPSNGEFILNVMVGELSDFSGIIDHVNVHISNRGEHIWRLKGLGCDRILADRLVLPPSGGAYDSYEGPAETIMKQLVDRHLVNPIVTGIADIDDESRTVEQLLIAADAQLGVSVKFEGRFQKVHEGLMQISRGSNDIGFDVNIVGNSLVFEVSEGTNRSASVVMAVELDNVADFTYDKDGMQFASHVIMGGSGEDAARLVATSVTPTSSRTNIERREVFQDSRDLTTIAALKDRGNALLQDKGQVDSFQVRTLVGTRPCYRSDYQVGDFITLRSYIYNVSQTVRIMEARIHIQAGQMETIDLGFAKVGKDFIKQLRSLPPVTASSRT